MTTYLDASVVLRVILGEPGRLAEWERIDEAVASALTQVECLRTLDRLHRQNVLDAAEVAERRAAVYDLMTAIHIADISPAVLRRASEPFSTPLGTLDAIHLSTALLWRDLHGGSVTMATHDQALAMAARAAGLHVMGA